MTNPQARFVVKNEADKDTAQIFILSDIGGWDGIQARDLVPEIQQIKASNIHLHLNSYGGDVFQGIAIYNALRDHPATVTTYVDGMAASAASFIALAGERIIMNRGSEMMIHDAMGACLGNAAEMRKAVTMLERVSNTIAGLYADRAGGTAEDWRSRMEAETWYSASEAVKAGLADEATGSDEASSQDKLRNQYSASMHAFKYQGRESAPAPEISNKSAGTDASASVEEMEPILQVDLREIFRDAFRGGH